MAASASSPTGGGASISSPGRMNMSMWFFRICAAVETASSGGIVPLVVTSRSSRSKSVCCPTRALSTGYLTLRIGEKTASRAIRPMSSGSS